MDLSLFFVGKLAREEVASAILATLLKHRQDVRDVFFDELAAAEGGITALAQLGSAEPEFVEGLRDAIKSGLIAGPTILSAGRALSPTSGGVTGWPEQGQDPPRRLPGTGEVRHVPRVDAEVLDTPEAYRKRIRRLFVDGADLVMLLLTSQLPSERLALTDDELHAAVDEAQRVGARIACLAVGLAPAKAAVRAGVDLLVFGPSAPDDELVRLLAAGRTAWAPSLVGRIDGGGTDLAAAVRSVHEGGGRIAAASGWRRGRNAAFADEIAALGAAGLSADAVLAAATVGGAQALGLSSGSLAAGQPANLAAFRGDPRSDLTCVARPGLATLVTHTTPRTRLTPLQRILVGKRVN